MEKSDIDIYSKSDLYYLATIGEYIRSNRISQNKTQLELAEDAGINRTTLSQLEKGKPVNILSLVQVLRALRRLHVFQEMEVKPQLSPMQFAAMEQKQRLRVKRANNKSPKQKSDW
jgi:transcriptional regulator with XRE-family HTH domain